MRAGVPSRYFLRNRTGRAVVLGTVAAVVAAGLVLVGAGAPVTAEAAVSPGGTELVSVDQASGAASGQPAVSADGRYVAFSTLRSLDPADVARAGDSDLDVYVRDRLEQRTILLSQGGPAPTRNAGGVLDLIGGLTGLANGAVAGSNGHSGNPSISADGRYVAFQTTANNLGAVDIDTTSDVVVVDRDPDGNGILDDGDCPPQRYCHQVTRVSPEWFDDQGRAITGAGAPSISAAGDALAWVGVSAAEENSVLPDAAPGTGTGVPVAYRSILEKGPTGAVTAVRSQQIRPQAPGVPVRGVSAPVLSADGNRLALVAETGPQSGTGTTTEARSAVLGVALTDAALDGTDGEEFPAVRLDVDGNGSPLALPAGYKAAPALSGAGRLVAFAAPGADSQVVRTVAWETGRGPRSEVVSADTAGNPVHGTDPALSADGRYLAYTTSARGTHNGVDGPDTQCSPTPAGSPDSSGTPAGSPDSSGTPAVPGTPAPGGPGTGAPTAPGAGPLGTGLNIDADIDAQIDPRISLDSDVRIGIGRRPADPGNPAGPGDPADPGTAAARPQPSDPAVVSHCDVVVRDLVQDRSRARAGLPRLPAELASPSLAQGCVDAPTPEATCEGDGASGYPALSGDGSVVAYESKATTLIPEDRNGAVQDVFARAFTPSLSADPLNFFIIEPGDSTVGSTTLRHVGFGPLPVQSATIGGADGAEFTVGEACAGSTLHAGDSCPATVRFSPAPDREGRHLADLTIGYRGSGAPLVLALLGISDRQPPRVLTFTPEPLSFGDKLPLSLNPPGDVRVDNTGNAPLTINAVQLPAGIGPEQNPADYRITRDGCTGKTVAPGASCAVTVQFSPQAVGERPAVLRFDDNAPKSPHLLALQGGGAQPTLRFDPAVVQTGRVTTLLGSGFAPGRAVTVTMPDATEPVTVTADGAGNFTTQAVIFSTTIPGERRVRATIAEHQPQIAATGRLLIVTRPAPPPGSPGGPR